MNQENKQPAPPVPSYPDDEINLLDLWRVLVRQWKVIAAITSLSVLGAVAYVLLATPVYEAQAVVRPPESKHVEALNIPGISEVSSADIFSQFTANLKNDFLLQQFMAETPQLSALHQQFADQTQLFLRDNVPQVKVGKKDEEGLVFLSLHANDAKLAAEWLNGFILLVEKKTIDVFWNGVEAKIDKRKQEIEIQLQVGTMLASQRRLDRIALLEEQIAIARAAKIFERKIADDTKIAGQSLGVTLNTVQEPLYMRGVLELTAEKETLEKRKKDEPFIAEFRDKQERLAQLAAGLQLLQAARATAHAVTVDQPAIEAKQPVKPRRMLVLALSLVLGGMIGVFAAFAINLVQEQKVKNKNGDGA